jgi:hypothetical protein
MKITARRRLALLAGLLLLAVIVFATGVQAALAATVVGTGVSGSGTASATQKHGSGFPVPGGQTATQAGSSATSSQLQGLTAAAARQHVQGVVTSVPAVTAPAGTQGGGGFDAAHFAPPQPQGLTATRRYARGGRAPSVANVSAAQAASSGTSSTTAWIAAGSAAAALIVGIAVWAPVRRRRRPGGRPSAAYCAQHPEDALCTTA